MKRFLLLLILLLPAPCWKAGAQTDYVSTAEDIALGKIVLGELAASPERDGPSLLLRTAKLLLDQPYVAGTQEGRDEKLRIFLTKTDCILFVETCMGFVLTSQRLGPRARFEDVAQILQGTRYRDGIVDGYASRLHYTTEWVAQAERNGLFREMTAELGGIPDTRPLNYMSQHPDSYAPLKGESEYARANRERIAAMEETVNRIPRHWIPKADLPRVERQIRSGDILCFVTSIGGLDVSHVVIAWREHPQDRLGFIHASSSAGKVVIEEKTLEAYLNASRVVSGIRVLRLAR